MTLIIFLFVFFIPDLDFLFFIQYFPSFDQPASYAIISIPLPKETSS